MRIIFLLSLTLLAPLFLSAVSARAAQPLQVLQFTPQGEVRHLNQIVVRFNEAMRPLGAMEQEADSSPLRLTACDGTLPAGSFRWLDPSTLAYLFDEPVDAPLCLEAVVSAKAKALSGAILDREVSWSLNTPPLALTAHTDEWSPDDKIPFLPPEKGVITLRSNYALDLATLKAALLLRQDGQDRSVALGPPEEPEWQKEQGRRGDFRPAEWLYRLPVLDRLPRGQALTLRLEPGLKTQKGAPSATGQEFSLHSFNPLMVLDLRIGRDAGAGTASPEEPVLISFNNPVRYKDLLAHLQVDPRADLPENNALADDPEYASRSHALPFAWKPRESYKLNLRPELEDTYGTRLAKGKSLAFTTGDLSPLLRMKTGDLVMEASLGGIFPLEMRNTGPVSLRFVHMPWNKEGLAAYSRGACDADAVQGFASLKGAREITLTKDTSESPNELLQNDINLPELFGFSDPRSMPGYVLVTATFMPERQKRGFSSSDPVILCARVQISGLGLTMKRGLTDSLAWVTDLQTGRPIAGVDLELVDGGGESLWQGRSDDQGLAVAPGKKDLPEKKGLLLLARRGQEIAVLPVEEKEGRWNAATVHAPRIPVLEKTKVWAAHAVTQLPLYRPGQEVRYVLYARAAAGPESDAPDAWLAEPGTRLALEVRDSRNKVVHQDDAVCNSYGSVSGTFVLSGEASLGRYSFRIKPEGSDRIVQGGSFQVAHFRAPEFRVNLNPPASRPLPLSGEAALSAGLRAGYFSGAALPGAKAVLDVQPRDIPFKPARLKGYVTSFNDIFPFFMPVPRPTDDPEAPIRLDATLDEEGGAAFALPRIRVPAGKPRAVALTATVTDASGLTSQGDASFILHPSRWYIGLRGPRTALPGKAFHVDFKAAGFDNQALSGLHVRVTAERLLPGKTDGERNRTETVLEKIVFLAAPEGEKQSFSFAREGVYYLTASVRDKEGRENAARLTIFVPGAGLSWFGPGDPGRLELVPDADQYKPGDTARIIIKNPFAQGTALITTERQGVRSARIMDCSGASPLLEVPVALEDAPYVYVSVTLVRGRTGAAPADDAAGEDTGRPQVRHAVLRLDVKAEKPVLEVELTTNQSGYRPGSEVKAAIRTSLRSGAEPPKPHKAQITLLAVDERILRAAGERTSYDPSARFQPLYRHGVMTTDLRTLLRDLSRLYDSFAKGAGLRSAAGGNVLLEAAAAPMAAQAADSAGSEPALREDFNPMVFWLAQGETTDAGVLETSFTLPDSVTSYRIVAVAADSADNFALAERSVTASKPLQLVSSMPRFLTGGDRMEARFLVQNLSARDGEILVEASAKGAVLERQSASLSVKAGASGLVAFPLQTRDPGSLSLTVRATMNGEGDAARFTLPVLPPAPLTVVAASGMVGEGAKKSLPVKLPEQLDPRSNLDLIIAPSPAAGMTLAAKQVLEYPWDCLEQRFSRAWARALRLEHGDMLGLPADPEDRGQIVEVLEAAARFQKSDGGFALWPGLPESNFYLTTYVLFVSSQMKDLELGLDRDVADRAYGYLMETLEAAQDNAAQDGKQRATAVRTGGLDAEALALGVLAGREQYQARAETLFQVLQEKSRAGKRQANPMRWSGLILAAHQLPGLPDRQKHLDRLTVALNNSVEITPTQAHFRSPSSESLWGTLGSTLRDNGLALAALSLARPDYPRLDAVASWVSQGLGDTPVLSTQEGAFGLWGLSRYLKSLGGDGTAEARATWDSQTINARFTRLTQPPVVWNLPADALAEGKSSELVVSAIKGKPCWTARLAYGHPDDLGQDLNAGFTLSREVDTPSPWRMGDEVTVTLTLTVPATRRHVLLFAPFPAGLEPLYASRTDLAAEKREYQHPWRYQDEYDDGLLLYAANVAPGVYTYTYILRAAAPGSFVHRSARVEEMYTPEVAGRCAGERVEVLGE